MRLAPEQITEIVKTFQTIFPSLSCELYLYGSRVHDNMKGGDIDLLLISNSDGCHQLQEKKYDLLVQLKKHPSIGPRRVDLLIVTPEQMTKEPFLKLIAEEKILLAHWGATISNESS